MDINVHPTIPDGFTSHHQILSGDLLVNARRLAHPVGMDWMVYIIRCSDDTFYTGITTDLERRFREHTEQSRGAKYFGGRKPVEVVYTEDGHSRSSAGRREAAIKKLGRGEKLKLIQERGGAAEHNDQGVACRHTRK